MFCTAVCCLGSYEHYILNATHQSVPPFSFFRNVLKCEHCSSIYLTEIGTLFVLSSQKSNTILSVFSEIGTLFCMFSQKSEHYSVCFLRNRNTILSVFLEIGTLFCLFSQKWEDYFVCFLRNGKTILSVFFEL